MSENDVRDGLRQAVAGEPPLDFDPDALVDTARRQVRRRALLSVGVATVAVVAAAVVIPLTLTGSEPNGGVTVADRPTATSQPDPGTHTPPAPPDFEWPPPGAKPVTYTADQLRERANEMRTYLQEVLPTVMPDATDIDVGLFGGEAEGAISDDQNYLNAFATFTIDGARYGIAVNTYAPGLSDDRSPADLCETSTCIQQGAADGGYLVTVAENAGEGKIVSAHHFRDSGAKVFVSGYNYDPTSHTAPVYHPSLPVGAELLGTLAADSRFDL